MKTKVSILVPVYNEQKTIKTILNKIIAQNLENMEREIVVVDDGSNDGTRQLLKECQNDPQVKLIFHEKNMGKGASQVIRETDHAVRVSVLLSPS